MEGYEPLVLIVSKFSAHHFSIYLETIIFTRVHKRYFIGAFCPIKLYIFSLSFSTYELRWGSLCYQ